MAGEEPALGGTWFQSHRRLAILERSRPPDLLITDIASPMLPASCQSALLCPMLVWPFATWCRHSRRWDRRNQAVQLERSDAGQTYPRWRRLHRATVIACCASPPPPDCPPQDGSSKAEFPAIPRRWVHNSSTRIEWRGRSPVASLCVCTTAAARAGTCQMCRTT
jgi:hypothetical protein